MNGGIGGGNGVHTVSPKQAKALVDEVQKSAASCKVKIDQDVNEFFGQLSKAWADKYAVDFAKEVERRISNVVSDLNKKSNNLMSDIVGLANDYANAGGLGTRIDYTICNFTASINTGAIKEEFVDGSSGFIGNNPNVSTGIIDKLEDLYKNLGICGDKLIESMQRTNAFGNTDVKAMLMVFAKNFKDGMTAEVYGLTSVCKSKISETQKRYQRVSSSYGGSNISSGAFQEYGPVTGNSFINAAVTAGEVAGGIASGSFKEFGPVTSDSFANPAITAGKVAGDIASSAFKEFGPVTSDSFVNPAITAGKVAGDIASGAFQEYGPVTSDSFVNPAVIAGEVAAKAVKNK